MKAPSSETAGPVVEWNYVFMLFWSRLVISAKVSSVYYIYASFLAFNFFFIHSILTKPSEEGLSVIDQEGITSYMLRQT